MHTRISGKSKVAYSYTVTYMCLVCVVLVAAAECSLLGASSEAVQRRKVCRLCTRERRVVSYVGIRESPPSLLFNVPLPLSCPLRPECCIKVHTLWNDSCRKGLCGHVYDLQIPVLTCRVVDQSLEGVGPVYSGIKSKFVHSRQHILANVTGCGRGIRGY